MIGDDQEAIMTNSTDSSNGRVCPYYGGKTFRISWTEWFCIPEKGFYTGTNGHEFT